MITSIFRALFFFLFVLANFSVNASSSQIHLNFSDIEKKYLERFFHAFFLDDDFSYTLFGAKPMSFSGLDKKESVSFESVASLSQTSGNLSLWNSFSVFKRYRKNISDRYCFVINEDEDSVFIYFIDKDSFLNTIESNIDLFLKELGEDFTAVKFLEEIIEEKTSFLDAIHHHEGILGILLGYGRHNSMLFQRKSDILGRCWAYGDDVKKESEILTTSSGFNSREEELFYLDEKLGSFSEESEYSSLMPVAPLGFAADINHIETQKLKHKYGSVRKLINEVYTRASPIDVIFDMLFSTKQLPN